MGGKKGTQEQRERQGRKNYWVVGWQAGRLAGGQTSRVVADFGLRKRFLKPIHTLAYLNVVLSFSLTGRLGPKEKRGSALGKALPRTGGYEKSFLTEEKSILKNGRLRKQSRPSRSAALNTRISFCAAGKGGQKKSRIFIRDKNAHSTLQTLKK